MIFVPDTAYNLDLIIRDIRYYGIVYTSCNDFFDVIQTLHYYFIICCFHREIIHLKFVNFESIIMDSKKIGTYLF